MNRRGFMKLLALTPLAGLIKPKQAERIILTGEQPPRQPMKWRRWNSLEDWSKHSSLHEGNIDLFYAELKGLLHDYPESFSGIITPKVLAMYEPKKLKQKTRLL